MDSISLFNYFRQIFFCIFFVVKVYQEYNTMPFIVVGQLTQLGSSNKLEPVNTVLLTLQ